jgi:hypothetical protein
VAAGVTGVFVLGSQAFASFFDFGLYIPANMLAAAAVMGVVSYQAHSLPKRRKFKSWIGCRLPNFAVSLVLVLLFGTSTAVSLDLYRRWVTQTIIRTPYVEDQRLERQDHAIGGSDATLTECPGFQPPGVPLDGEVEG